MEIVSLAGAVTASTLRVRSGTYAFRVAPAAAAANFVEEFYTANTAGQSFHQTWWYIETMPLAESVICSWDTAAGTPQIVMTLDASGVLRLRSGTSPAGTLIGSASSAVSAGAWFSTYVDIDCTTIASGVLSSQLDGVAWNTSSSFSIGTALSRRRIGTTSASYTYDLFVDDMLIADGATVLDRLTKLVDVLVASDADTSLRGAGQGTSWDTGPSTGLTAWQMLDETPTPNDGTDYVFLNATSAGSSSATILDFGLDNPASYGIGSGDTIKFLEVNHRHRAATASNKNDILRLKGQSGGTVTESASLTYGATTWLTNRETAARMNSRLISLSNPQDGSDWTRATIATAVVGVRSTDVSPNPWVSKIWVTVAYVPVAAGSRTTKNTRSHPLGIKSGMGFRIPGPAMASERMAA